MVFLQEVLPAGSGREHLLPLFVTQWHLFADHGVALPQFPASTLQLASPIAAAAAALLLCHCRSQQASFPAAACLLDVSPVIHACMGCLGVQGLGVCA